MINADIIWYITVQKICTFFLVLKEVSYAHKDCIYLIKYSKNSNIVEYYFNL